MNSKKHEPRISILLAALSVTFALRAANPVPFVNNPLVPTSVAPGSPAFTLTVNGANFVSGAAVYWNGSPRSTKFASSTQVTATITPADVAARGTATVTVGNPGTGAMSNLSYFSVSSPRSAAIAPLSFALSSQQIVSNLFVFAVGDFNGDGKLDFAALNATQTSVDIYLGSGDGTFQPPISYSVATFPSAIVVGDFNGDGRLDLALEGALSSEFMVTILLGDGDGTFVAQPVFAGGASGYSPVLAVGDFNGDGNLDLIAANEDNLQDNVAVFLGNGDGSFQPYKNIQVDSSNALPISDVKVGDFNGDGNLDVAALLAATGDVPGTFQVLLGQGNGSFEAPTAVSMIQPADQFAFADMNGDGITDVVATTGGGIQYMRGRGNGTFEPESQVESFTGTYGIALEDLNADNKVDVVTSTFSSGGTTIMNEKTGFGTPATLPTNYGAVSYHTAIGDFNGDGEPDFILSEAGIFLSVSSYLTPTSLVFPLGTVGTPDPPQTITLTNSGSEAVGITGYTFSGPEPLDFSETNDCEGAIRAHSSCTVTVTYLPIGGSTSTAYLSIEEGSNTAQTVSLTGSASGVAPVVTLSGYQLNWPSVPVGMPGGTAQVKLTNIGNGNLTSLSVGISGTDSSDFAITANTCAPTVRAGAACAVTVQFTPTATGTRSATLTFTDNAYGSPQTVVLEGSGS